MVAQGARMRLTVEVLPLIAENVHGPHQAAALAAFKGRKFALPVQTEHTFEQVWRQIEDRYKKNYLSAVQATSFTIKKLQDAYDCDLDLSDTVGDIFEGESDAQMRTIKVVPSFINRDFSMPVTSNLRPGNAQKRIREINEEHVNKRRRLEEAQQELVEADPARDRPVTSTELERSGEEATGKLNARLSRKKHRSRSRRSKSGSSFTVVYNSQTGNEEFTYSEQLKEESPELGLPPSRPIPDSPEQFKKPLFPASKRPPSVRQRTRSPSNTSRRSPNQPGANTLIGKERSHEASATQFDTTEDASVPVSEPTSSAPEDSEVTAIHKSPTSTPEPTEVDAVENMNLEMRSASPAPFMGTDRVKHRRTFGRDTITSHHAKEAAQLLNGLRSEQRSTGRISHQHNTQPFVNGKARLFQNDQRDEIESTPPESTSSTSRPVSRLEDDHAELDNAEGRMAGSQELEKQFLLASSRSGGLKRPSQTVFNMSANKSTPASNSRSRRQHLLTNLGVKSTQKAKKTPKKGRERSDSDAKSSNASLSASTRSANTPGISPSVRAGTASLIRDTKVRKSPKVVIPARTSTTPVRAVSATQELPRTLTPIGGENGQDSATKHSHDVTKLRKFASPTSNSYKDITQSATPHREPEELASTKKPASLIDAHADTMQSSGPRRTPVPLPNDTVSRQQEGTLRLSNERFSLGPSQTSQASVSSTRTDIAKVDSGSNAIDVVDTDSAHGKIELGYGSIKHSSHAATLRTTSRRSEVPLPDNVRHLTGASPGTVKAYCAIPSSSGKRNSQASSASVAKSESPALSRPHVRSTKNGLLGSASRAVKHNGPAILEHTATMRPQATTKRRNANAAENAIVVSSGGSSSEAIDCEESLDVPAIVHKTPSPIKHAANLQEPSSSTKKKHSAIVARMFPKGLEKSRNDFDVREYFGDFSEDPITQPVEEQGVADSDEDAQFNASTEKLHSPNDLPNQLACASAKDSTGASEAGHSRAVTPGDPTIAQIAQEEAASRPAPWNSESWGFDDVDKPNGNIHTSDQNLASKSNSLSSPLAASIGSTGSDSGGNDQHEADDELEDVVESKSRSTSAVNSARSSPEVTRRPARYLSHSPTPEGSDTDSESITSQSRSRSEAAIVDAVEGNEDTDSDDSSGDSSLRNDSETEGQDVEMLDASKDASAAAEAEPRSSPPALPPQQSVIMVPATQSSQLQYSSQPASSRRTKVLSPSNVSANATQRTPISTTVGSSQSISQLAASRRATYKHFPSVKDQLTKLLNNPASSQSNNKFDPRTSNLGRLARKTGKVVSVSDSSDDESSSSSSSDEEELLQRRNGGSCSVA